MGQHTAKNHLDYVIQIYEKHLQTEFKVKI